jgi:hypothetical protein
VWWVYAAALIGVLAYAALSPRPRRLAIVAAVLLLCIIVHVVSSSYLGMLYAAAQKDSLGNIVWTLDLADRVRDITAVMYVNSIALVIALFLALWTAYEYGVQTARRW